jgi:hypothetical protein
LKGTEYCHRSGENFGKRIKKLGERPFLRGDSLFYRFYTGTPQDKFLKN